MKKRKVNINQHYVPQFYLRNFVNNEGVLYVFDIKRNVKYKSNPKNECRKKYFYDIETSVFDIFNNSTINYEELVDEKLRTYNEKISAMLFNFLGEIIKSNVNFNFPNENRNILYNFILLQLYRTPFFRERLYYLNLPFTIKTKLSGELGDEKTVNIIHNLLLYGLIEKLYNENFFLGDLYYAIFDHLLDEILNIKNQLIRAGKLFLVNKSKKEFFCSSSPVNVLWKFNPLAKFKALVTPTKASAKMIDIGHYIEFLTIFIPISSDVAIFMFDKSYDENLTAMNLGIGIISDWNSDIIDNLNLSSLLKCEDKIFSAHGNYNDIISMKIKKQNPVFNFRFTGQ